MHPQLSFVKPCTIVWMKNCITMFISLIVLRVIVGLWAYWYVFINRQKTENKTLKGKTKLIKRDIYTSNQKEKQTNV